MFTFHFFPSHLQGQKIFDTLKAVAKEKDLKIRIVVDIKEDKISNDTEMLEEEGLAEVRRIDMAKLFGSGVLHTKMWLVDGKHFAVGSANLDWRSLTEVRTGFLLHSFILAKGQRDPLASTVVCMRLWRLLSSVKVTGHLRPKEVTVGIPCLRQLLLQNEYFANFSIWIHVIECKKSIW